MLHKPLFVMPMGTPGPQTRPDRRNPQLPKHWASLVLPMLGVTMHDIYMLSIAGAHGPSTPLGQL